jgi:hypothetical protein
MPRNQRWLLVELFASANANGALEWQAVYDAGDETVIVSPASIDRIAAPWSGIRREVAPDLCPGEAVERARMTGFCGAPTAIAVRFLNPDAARASYVVAFDDGRCAAIDATSGAVCEVR